MLLEQITNKKQLDAIEKHSIDISQFESKEDLSKHLLDISKKKYYEKNKEKFKEYYKQNADKIKEKQKQKRIEKKESIKKAREDPNYAVPCLEDVEQFINQLCKSNV